MAKMDLEALKNKQKHQPLLNEKKGPNRRIPDEERLTDAVRVYLKPREKAKLDVIARYNRSAFIRDILIEAGVFKDA
jgi:hypothetical protein